MRQFRRLLLATAAFASLTGSAFAQNAGAYLGTPDSPPMPPGTIQGMPPVPPGLPQYTPPPALQALLNQGINLTFIGGDGGMMGYLGRFPSARQEGGQAVKYDYQTFYITPDGNSSLVGMMFDKSGANITDAQINSVKNRYAALAAAHEAADQKAAEAATQQPSVTAEASPAAALPVPKPATIVDAQPPAVPADPAQPVIASRAPVVPEPAVPAVQASAAPAPVVPAPQQVASVVPPALVSGDAGLHLPGTVQPLISHNAFMAAADTKSVWLTVGAKGAPEIYMIADPSCGFCHAAWSVMKPLIDKQMLMVHVIPVAILAGSDQKVISILATPKPSTAGTTWLAGYGSTDMAVRPPPPPTSPAYVTADTYLKMNMEFIKILGIHPTPPYIATPFIAYMGKHGWRAAEGPDDVAAFLEDLPSSPVALPASAATLPPKL